MTRNSELKLAVVGGKGSRLGSAREAGSRRCDGTVYLSTSSELRVTTGLALRNVTRSRWCDFLLPNTATRKKAEADIVVYIFERGS